MRKAIRFISGAILGGILGSTAVLLLTPGSGSENLAALRQRFSLLQNQMQNAMQEKRAQLEDELESLKKA